MLKILRSLFLIIIAILTVGIFSCTQPDNPAKEMITVHFYYTGTDIPNIYTWDSGQSKFFGPWPGRAMTAEGNNWYQASMVKGDNVIFNYSGGQTSDLSRSAEGWYYKSTWISTSPLLLPPEVSAESGIENGTSEFAICGDDTDYKISLQSFSFSPISSSTYKINSDPTVNYSDGQKIDINSILSIGDSLTLQLSVTNSVATVQKTYTYKKVAPPSVTKLGANYYTGDNTSHFALWSPDTANVSVNINGTDYPCTRRPDCDGYRNVYQYTTSGDAHLTPYYFKVNGVKVRDPYGSMIDPSTQNNIFIDLTQTTPSTAWASRPTLTEREDSIIYEVHVRDFTIDTNSGVSQKGKYLGMVETGTTFSGQKTGIDHLKELGITHVQIMPVYDFGSTMYNWGYDPVNYNIPEEQYSQYSGNSYVNRINEFKTLINEFHKNGIRVIMDVVYNHTQSNDMFNKITGKYYDGMNLSGCGNSIDTSQPMVSRYIRDSLDYWISEYHVDGFRFDLLGIFYYEEAAKWTKYLNDKYSGENLLFYGEPWNGYASDPNENQKVRLGKVPALSENNVHLGVFNPKYREHLKGDNDGTGMGYIFDVDRNNSWNKEIESGLKGSIMYTKSTSPLADSWDSMFAYDPDQSINYISAHDNFCLWDKIRRCNFDNETGKEIDRFGMGIILTSQGIPFIHGGDEMLRTKLISGNWEAAKNSYNAGDGVNAIQWQWKVDNASTFKYYKDLIALRKLNTNFRLNSWDEINSNITVTGANTFSDGSPRVIITQINNNPNSSPWTKTLTIYNSSSLTYAYTLPGSGTWYKIADKTGKLAAPTSHTGGISTDVDSRAVTIFYQ